MQVKIQWIYQRQVFNLSLKLLEVNWSYFLILLYPSLLLTIWENQFLTFNTLPLLHKDLFHIQMIMRWKLKWPFFLPLIYKSAESQHLCCLHLMLQLFCPNSRHKTLILIKNKINLMIWNFSFLQAWLELSIKLRRFLNTTLNKLLKGIRPKSCCHQSWKLKISDVLLENHKICWFLTCIVFVEVVWRSSNGKIHTSLVSCKRVVLHTISRFESQKIKSMIIIINFCYPDWIIIIPNPYHLATE